ncbi:hypothetical protein BJV82DRAFT_602856 [Fennellomyces sp. T-0311]|nr:hypothetical protein BJV82DRAFT_602856 [Fennellomyces sp. T-0311]
MPPITLKFTGNTPFTKIDSVNELRETWKVCTKVKDSLENGSRLENLSWRLWFVHNADESKKNQKRKEEAQPPAPPVPLPAPPPEPLTNAIQQQIEYRRMLRRQQHEQFRQKITEQNYDQSCDAPPVQTYLPNMDWQQPTAENIEIPLDSEAANYYAGDAIQSVPNSPVYATSTLQDAFNASNASCEQSAWNLLLPDSDPAAFYISGAIPSPVPNGALYSKLLSTLPRDTLESVERLFMPHAQLHAQVPQGMMTSLPQQQPEPVPPPPPAPSSDSTSPSPKSNHHQKKTNNVYISTLHFPQQNQQQRNKSTTTTTTVRRSLPVKSTSSPGQPVCSNCSTTTTPLWRRSADDELLCNACGLYLKLHNAPRPKHLKPHSGRKDTRGDEDGMQQPICTNCATSTTPLWRRDDNGAPLCNACGLYLKLHNQRRPLSLKSDTIKKRQRAENTETARRSPKKSKNEDSSPIVQLLPSSHTNMSQQHFYYQPS